MTRALSRILHERPIRDGIVILAISLVTFVYAASTDLFEELHAFAAAHDDWQIDELFILFIVLSIAGLVYAIRRVRDLHNENRMRRAAEQQAQLLALHDALTGLPNRRFFREKLFDIVPAPDEPMRRAAVLMLDLDGFKSVNDMHGHPAGDRMLIDIAGRLTALVNDGVVARLGGDEFAIILPTIDSPAQLTAFARRVIGVVEQPVMVGDIALAVGVGVSIGIAIAPDDGSEPDELVRRADLALYRAKESGRSSIRFFESNMDALVERRLLIERELRLALANDEVVPHYQPLVSLGGERVVGFEALARWTCPGIGDVPPNVFIQVAEESGLISALGDQLLRRACLDAKSWPADITLSFNISPIQLRDQGLGLRILSILAQTGLNPHRLEIEITESALVENMETAQRITDELRGAGVRVALDDFGTGYATLSQLLALQLDKIKIDRSFISHLGQNNESMVIVRAILGLASGFGLTTTAEGVETEQQLATLKANGCTEAQGYLFGRAIPANEVALLLGDKQKQESVA